MVARDPADGPSGRLPLLPGRVTPRLKVGAVVVLLLTALAVAVAVSALGSHGSSVPVGSVRTSSAPPSIEVTIYVHLLGAVAEPGLYALPDGARVIDGIAAAGGFAATADRAAVNLARFLSDGEQLSVPVVGDVPTAPAQPGTIGGKVNLNTADAAILETLPRVGPAMAARIIAWREANGRFAVVEDLQGVDGIGDKTFTALRDLVTV